MTAKPLYAIGRLIIHLSDTAYGRVAFATVLGIVGGIVALAAHGLAKYLGAPEYAVDVAGAVAIGVFLSLLTYVEISAVRERRSRVVKNLRTVAELNHVVRNSLQAIQYAAKLSADDQHVRIINDCVHRIESALQELFPVIVDPRQRHRSAETHSPDTQNVGGS